MSDWLTEVPGRKKGVEGDALAKRSQAASIHQKITEELNERHFLVRLGKDEVIATIKDDGEVVFQQAASLRLRYLNQLVEVGQKIKNGEIQAILKSKFEIWVSNTRRKDYRCVVFSPPPIACDSRDYNLWRGFAVTPDVQSHPEQRCQRYLDFVLSVICDGNQEHYEYLLDDMAHTVQRPGRQGDVAKVLCGERGTGKSVFAGQFGQLFGTHYSQISKPDQIVGKFNAACSHKVVIFADEAFYAGDKKELGALKVLITESTLQIERKGLDPVTEPNCVHLFMASNEDWHTPAGFQERRFFVLKVNSSKRRNLSYFSDIQNDMAKGGREALLAFLLARPLTNSRRLTLREAPITEELRIQQEMTMPPELKWWQQCLIDGRIGDLGWPQDYVTEDVHKKYLAWCEQLRINRRVPLVEFGRRIMSPYQVGERRQVGSDKRHTLMGLLEAREQFDTITGTRTPWVSDLDDDIDDLAHF